MIPRYTREPMKEIWSDEFRFRLLIKIEFLCMEARAGLGEIPRESLRSIAELADAEPDLERIRELEQTTRHETLAFLTWLSECMGGQDARYLHLGMTSSDALDTCFSIQLVKATDLILAGLRELLDQLQRRAFEFKHQLCIGRSHGVHGEPTTFGLKLAQAHAEFQRVERRIESARNEIAVGAISGPMGTFATVPPQVEAHVCERLGLQPETASTQVIPRDRHAQYFATLGAAASSVERLAVELRNLQRSEILEVEEPFRKDQKGSSAMPHKRNPILSENVTGLARLVRSTVVPALENVALWHERDMSHSSVERVIAPDATAALDFAIWRMSGVVRGMSVRPANMKRNLGLMKGIHNSHRVLDALVRKGMERNSAYALVQKYAMMSLDEQRDYLELLASDGTVSSHLPGDELATLFDNGFFTRHVDELFERVFGEAGKNSD